MVSKYMGSMTRAEANIPSKKLGSKPFSLRRGHFASLALKTFHSCTLFLPIFQFCQCFCCQTTKTPASVAKKAGTPMPTPTPRAILLSSLKPWFAVCVEVEGSVEAVVAGGGS